MMSIVRQLWVEKHLWTNVLFVFHPVLTMNRLLIVHMPDN